MAFTLILGPLTEKALRQALSMSGGSLAILTRSYLATGLLVASAAGAAGPAAVAALAPSATGAGGRVSPARGRSPIEGPELGIPARPARGLASRPRQSASTIRRPSTATAASRVHLMGFTSKTKRGQGAVAASSEKRARNAAAISTSRGPRGSTA